MSGNEEYEGATAGRVLVFDESESVSFPSRFKEAMGTNRGLMVLVHKDRLIKIFPLENDDVSYLSLEIGKLTNDFLTKLHRSSRNVDLLTFFSQQEYVLGALGASMNVISTQVS